MAEAQQCEACTRLREVPGIGAQTATALVAAIRDGRAFDSGRDLTAWLGLTPREQLPWRSTLPLHELAEEALGGSRVPTVRHQDVEDVAVLVHCSPEVVAFPADPDQHLIQVPDIA